MSGVAVIRYLLVNYAALTTIVPSTRIRAGVLPLNTVLPAIAINQIDSTPRLTLGMNEAYRYVTDRVQVTTLIKSGDSAPSGNDYGGLIAIMKLLPKACPNQRGTINGVDVQCIVPEMEGPDLVGEDTGILSRGRDFLVSYVESTA